MRPCAAAHEWETTAVSRRTERIGEQLREELAGLIRREVTDPRVVPITLTRVDVAPDLSHALVFWSALDIRDETDPESVGKGLASAAGFLRRKLSSRLSSLRRMPEFRFEHDPSIERGSEMLDLLKRISDE